MANENSALKFMQSENDAQAESDSHWTSFSQNPTGGTPGFNLLRQIVYFWEWRLWNPVSHTEADLYFTILYYANKIGRIEWFNLPNSLLEIWFDKKTLQNARNGLMQKGLILYEKGKKGQAPKYKVVIIRGKNDPNSFPNLSPITSPIASPMYPPYIKEKDKDNIPPIIPPRGDASGKRRRARDADRLSFDLDALYETPKGDE